MAALIEDIYFGTENYADQPEAIFVWLSDSPALNEQSKQKIDLKADRIKHLLEPVRKSLGKYAYFDASQALPQSLS